ncbi:putative RNA-binding protein Luc7-like 2 [Nasonia vitripennis]|uniref:Uncharacterized protein n=1 Tax=Nasonia vitripennis TaxID=7425 RepID=A0A7M7TDL7_NASVI|nr:putative RNA-binding protein Luc7-like 2 [Nasonia vitripennis]
MAPTKRPRENATRNRDKTRRRKRAQEVRPLFKFMGQLCGEECEQDLTPVSESAGRGSARRDNGSRRREMLDDAEMDGIAEELSDEEYDEPRNPAPARSGRLAKAKLRKSGQGGQASEMPLKIGVQKAMRYICEALAFGLQSGYLTPRDSKGKLLRVSSELFQTPEPARGRAPPRNGPEGSEARADRRQNRRQRRPEPSDSQADGKPDDEGAAVGAAVGERGQQRSRKQRSRSGSRHKRRSGKSRSRSRSKRRHGRKRSGRSHSEKPEAELRAKQIKPEQEPEQDEMDENGKESSGGRNEDDNEDGKSAKSTLNSDSQNSNEEKKRADEDGASDEDEDEDEDGSEKNK